MQGYEIVVRSSGGCWIDQPEPFQFGDKWTCFDEVEAELANHRGEVVDVTNWFNGSVTRFEVTPEPFGFGFSMRPLGTRDEVVL